MLMNELLKMGLFSLLTEISLVSNEEIKNAYEDFAQTLLKKLQTEIDIVKLYYSLNFVRLEFAGLQTSLQNGQGEKCAKLCRQNHYSN